MMKFFVPIAKVDAERREVWGYASTEARDDQGEVIKRDALQAALGDYMQFANIREMHQLSAVGTAKEAAVDDKGLYVGAKIVDPLAWEKVVEGVYKGYSIGGRVTQRDPHDYKTITGLVLNEISLVDRPANPEAVFDYWKAAGTGPAGELAEKSMSDPFNAPFQIWACGDPAHRHIAKADAIKCVESAAAKAAGATAAEAAAAVAAPVLDALAKAEAAAVAAKGGDDPGDGKKPYGNVEYADPGLQSDGKKRYPIDSEKHIRAAWNYINKPKNAKKYSAADLDKVKAKIVAAWKAKIDKDGPPSADDKEKAAGSGMLKALWDVGHVAHIILDLDWLQGALEVEAAMEGDESPQPARLQAIVGELCGFLNALVAEETAEVLEDTEVSPGAMAMAPMAMASHAPFGKGLMAALDGLIAASAQSAGAASQDGVAAKARADAERYQKFKADLAEAMVASSGALGKAGAKHSAHDQALLDLGYHACAKCAGMDGLGEAAKGHMDEAAKCFKAAGAGEAAAVDAAAMHSGTTDSEAGVKSGDGNTAVPQSHPPAPEYHGQNATVDTRDNPESKPPMVDPAGTGAGSHIDQVKAALFAGIDAILKRNGGHQALMDAAHDCCAKVSGGMTCGSAEKAGARHSAETMSHLHKAHEHLMMAGATCDKAANAVPGGTPNAKGETEGQGTEFEAGKAAGTADLTKVAAERDALAKAINDMAPRIDALIKQGDADRAERDQLKKRVEEIEKQPLPPKTVISEEALAELGLRAIAKGGTAKTADAEISDDDLAKAWANKTEEERSLFLIKAAQRRPMAVPGSGTRLS